MRSQWLQPRQHTTAEGVWAATNGEKKKAASNCFRFYSNVIEPQLMHCSQCWDSRHTAMSAWLAASIAHTDKQSTWNMIATHYWSVMCTRLMMMPTVLLLLTTAAFPSPAFLHCAPTVSDSASANTVFLLVLSSLDMRWQAAKGVNQWINNPAERSISIAARSGGCRCEKEGKEGKKRVCVGAAVWINE